MITPERGGTTLPIAVKELNPSGTYLEVSGAPELVEQWWEGYQKDYHPWGYGTRINRDATVDGIRTIRTSRSSSCD